MWCVTCLTVRRVVSLLMLATLLVYAAPGRATLLSYHSSQAPHEHILVDTGDGTIAAVADHEHEQGPCKDLGLRDDGVCCNVAQCATMHGAVLAAAAEPFIPNVDMSNHLPVVATPNGIGIDPALRPPCLII